MSEYFVGDYLCKNGKIYRVVEKSTGAGYPVYRLSGMVEWATKSELENKGFRRI